MKELFNNPKEEEYLSEFKQKVAQEMQEDIEQRRRELERSRNGFIGSVAGIILAGLVSWFLLLPRFGFNSNKEIPIIRRPILPVKIQPSEPGGMEILNQDKTVYSLVEKNDDLDTTVESLLPAPETPKMPTITAEEEAPSSANPLSEESPENMDELIAAVETSATEKLKIPEKLPVIDVKVLKTNEPLTQKQETEKDVDVAEQKPSETLQEKPSEKPLASASLNEGKWSVQMMASSKKDAVEKGYQQLVKQYSVLKNLPYQIESGNDGLSRLKVGSYQTKADAESLCSKIKQSGGSCMVKEK